MIITKQEFSKKEKLISLKNIQTALVNTINAPVDLIIKSEAEVNNAKNLPGHIVKEALKNGIKL